jgi:hypothetical protein
MESIAIKSHSSEKVLPLIKNAIEREKRIIQDSLQITREKVKSHASRLGIDLDLLVSGSLVHTETNDMELLELEGEISILNHLEESLKELEELEICR